MATKSKVDEALAAVFDKPSGCWVTRIDPEAQQFMNLLRDREDAGTKPNRAATAKALKDYWDIVQSEEMVRAHLRRRCKCQ